MTQRDSTHFAGNQHRERRHQLNTERQLVELRQQVEQLGTMMGRCLMMSHNSDLRYSHEYIQSQVWGER